MHKSIRVNAVCSAQEGLHIAYWKDIFAMLADSGQPASC